MNMSTINQIQGAIPGQFPVPVRPLSAPGKNNAEFSDRATDNWTGIGSDSGQKLRWFLDELENHETFKKIVSRLEMMGIPVERLVQGILHESRGKPSVSEVVEKLKRKLNSGGVSEGATNTSRDVNGDLRTSSEGEGLSEDRLERFKVKTVNVVGGGVVKEEQSSYVL